MLQSTAGPIESTRTRGGIVSYQAMAAALCIGISALAMDVVAATQVTEEAQAAASSTGKINTILDRWQAVEAGKGGNVALWRDMMGIQLRQVMPGTLDRLLALSVGDSAADNAQFYQSYLQVLGTDIALRLQTKQADTHATANANAQSGKASPQSLGDTTVDQTFIPITPCRIVDTRNVGGPITSFAARNFFYYTTDGTFNWFTNQGGVFGAASSTCPATVFSYSTSAAIATVTVTGQGGAGNLVVWGGANPVASASTLSYGASGDVANLAVVPWGGRTGAGPGGLVKDFGVFVNAFSSANIVIDIVGYYTAPQATALDCVWTAPTVTNITANSSASAGSPVCAAGYTMTGGTCYLGSADATLVDSGGGTYFPGIPGWYCYGRTGATATTLSSFGRCCRTPGR
jgi:hypothetical protein